MFRMRREGRRHGAEFRMGRKRLSRVSQKGPRLDGAKPKVVGRAQWQGVLPPKAQAKWRCKCQSQPMDIAGICSIARMSGLWRANRRAFAPKIVARHIEMCRKIPIQMTIVRKLNPRSSRRRYSFEIRRQKRMTRKLAKRCRDNIHTRDGIDK